MDFKKLEYYERIEAKYRYLLTRFQAADVKMDGVCSWRFVHNPMLMGRSADAAVESAVAEVYDRERATKGSDKSLALLLGIAPKEIQKFMEDEFRCSVCKAETKLGSNETELAICETCCGKSETGHKFEYDPYRRAKFCERCDAATPDDYYFDDDVI